MIGPTRSSGGGGFTLFIVLFLLSVISVMSGYLYFTVSSQADKIDKELSDAQVEFDKKFSDAQAEFEKKQLEDDTTDAVREAQLLAESEALKKREEQVKKLEERVGQELDAAADAVREANRLKREATSINETAAEKLAEAEEAQNKADASGSEKDKKLAEEKKRIADEAAALIADANERAEEAIANAKSEASKAIELKTNLDKVKDKLTQAEENIRNKQHYTGETVNITLRGGSSGKFCTDRGDDGVICNVESAGDSEAFKVHQVGAGDSRLAFSGGKNGLFCTEDINNKMICNQYKIGPNEIFYAESGGNGIGLLRGGRSGLYCKDTIDGIICNDDAYGDAMMFKLGEVQSSTNNNKIPKGRYVRLTFDEVTGKSLKWVLIVQELRVFGKDGTTNLALNKPVEVSGLHNAAKMKAAYAVDGDPSTFWHSLTSTGPDFIEVDLGEEKEIYKIEVINHKDGNKPPDNRMAAGGPDGPGDDGAYIIIKDEDKAEVIKTDPIKKIAQKYTYNFNVKTPEWK